MAEPLRIEIDREACVGSAACEHRAPDLFAIGEDGKAVARQASADAEESAVQAARCCPNVAIAVWRGDRRIA